MTHWFDRGWFPVYVGYCPDEDSWNEQMKEMGVLNEPYPKSAGRCTVFTKDKTVILITMNDPDDKWNIVEHIALMAHELQHTLDFIFESIGEEAPSRELKAYGMQCLMLDMMSALEKEGDFKIEARKNTTQLELDL